MLTDAELEALFDSQGTPEVGRSRIRRIRDTLPARATRTNKRSAKSRYAPVSMPFVIEVEATATEYAAAVEFDHDPNVLEFYSQVEALTVEYRSGTEGRRVRFPTTPDFFCIRADKFVYVECKTEEELISLGRKSPNRFQRGPDGCWRSPPGELAAAEFGCGFEVRSTAQNNWTLIENVEILKDYVHASSEIGSEVKTAISSRLEERGWLSLFELVHMEPEVPVDALYSLIARKELFFPIATQRLADQDRACVFRDAQTHDAHAVFISAAQKRGSSEATAIEIRAGSLFTWDDKPWQILNSGSTLLSIRSLDTEAGIPTIAELSNAQFLELVGLGRIRTVTGGAEVNSTEAEEILRRASPKDLSKAQAKYAAIQTLVRSNTQPLAAPLRTLYFWQREYRDGEARYGNGFVGLVPKRRGNRTPKASVAALELADEVIAQDWETIRHKKRLASYGTYSKRARSGGISKISYVTFCKRVKARSGANQHAKRFGEKAAYDQEPQYLEVEYTTQRHGVRPWHIGHIDHTPLPLKFVHSKFGSIERTIWLTILMDAYSRKILAYYLSFDEPSYRSCMMVLRDCVRRHHRVPQIIVCDGGPEFSSAYWETQLASVGSTKRDRRAGRPREGSVCERTFDTTQSQLVKSLLGATDVVEKYFRRISPEVRPERHAVWTLDQFDIGFQRYLDEVYHVNPHGGLGMSPNAAWALGIKSHGTRNHIAIPYDKLFIIQSCPAVHRGQVKVLPAGVKINYRWFKCEALTRPGALGTNVPARYDPFNSGIAYVYVQREWHECRSEMYSIFAQRSEREIRLITEHLRLTSRQGNRNLSVTAERVADLLQSLEEEEAEGAQLRADREAMQHRRKINTPQVDRDSSPLGKPFVDVLSPPIVGRLLEDL